MKLTVIGAFIAIWIFMISSGCTREQKDVSKFNISVPTQKTMSSKTASAQAVTGTLAKVIINVRGTGIQIPISINFDADDEGGSTSTLPSTFPIEVPSGPGRLIQLLAVYIDSSSQNGEFYYGDTTMDLSGGEVNVTLPITLAGSGSVQGGRVSGRYFAADGSKPTGIVESRYQPPSGKPPMVLERGSMIEGWFNAFALDSVPLDIGFALRDEKIFSSFTLNSLTYTDNKKMRVKIPSYYKTNGDGSGDERSAQSSIIGFFGPGVPVGSKVCFTQSSYSYTNLFTDASKTTVLQWNPVGSGINIINADKDASVSTCTAGEIALSYTTVLPFEPSLLNNWGGAEAASGFFGAFRFPTNTSNGSAPVNVSFDNLGQFKTIFSVLPGIPVLADSIGIFYRANKSPRDYGRSDEAPCHSIANGGYGFKSAGSIPLTIGTQDYTVTKPAPSDISENAVFAFCPMRSGVSLGGGFINRHIWSGSGGGPTPANSFGVESYYKMGADQCHKISIPLAYENGGNFNKNVTNDVIRNFTLTLSGAEGLYADEVNCQTSTNPISNFSIPSGMTKGEIWIKTGSSPGTATVTITSPSSFGTSLTKVQTTTVAFPSAAAKLVANVDNIRLAPFSCQTVELMAVDSNDYPALVGSDTTVSLEKRSFAGPVSDTSFDFYDDCASPTPVVSVTIPIDKFKTKFAIKSVANPSNERIVGATAFGQNLDIYLNIAPIADHLAIELNRGQKIYKGSCVPVKIQANDILNSIIAAASFQFHVHTHPNSGYGSFYYGCSIPASGPFSLSGGLFNLTYLAEAPTPGPQQMDAGSIFISSPKTTPFEIFDVQAFSRATTLKVHLTSDVLETNQSSVTSWQTPIGVGFPTSAVNSSGGVITGPSPGSQGAILSNTSSYFGGSLSALLDDEISMTVRFKLDTLTVGDILTISDPLNTSDLKIYTYFDGMNYRLKGTGGWMYSTPLTAGTWYTVTLTRDGTQIAAFVNGAGAGSGTGYTSPGSNFSQFKIGLGIHGAVKAVIIDAGSGASGVSSTDHTYILGRVP